MNARSKKHDETFKKRRAKYIYGEGDDYELYHAVADWLEDQKQSICVLEMGHDSLIDSWLSSLERPDLFRGGMSLPSGRFGDGDFFAIRSTARR